MRKNRKVNRDVSLETLDIPDEGLSVHLRGYGWVTVFKFVAKNGRVNYESTNMENLTRDGVKKTVEPRWAIEVYHREWKQICGIERCQARTGRTQRNHICLSILAWLDKHRHRISEQLSLCQQDWEMIKDGISNGIRMIMAAR